MGFVRWVTNEKGGEKSSLKWYLNPGPQKYRVRALTTA